MKLHLFLVGLLDRYPAAGYLGAAVPTGLGFWALVEYATKIGGLISIALGVAVGVVTYRVQRKKEKLLDAQLLEQRQG